MEIPEETRRRMFAFTGGLAGLENCLRMVKEENLHITLKFLGAMDKQRVDGLGAALEKAVRGLKPFTVEFSGIGVFPPKGAPRILWADVSDKGDIASLKLNIEAQLSELGFEEENKHYRPHITLARFRGRIDKNVQECLRGLLSRANTVNFGGMRISSLSLMESILEKEGARYSRLLAVPLSGPPRTA